MKKTASSLLAVLTALLLLTGCAGREEEQAEDYAYAAHYTELSDVKGVDMPCCLAGGRLYFTGTAESEPIIIYGEAEDENGEPVMLESSYTTQVEAVYSLGLEELDLRRESYSPEPLPEGARGDTDVADLAVFGDGGLAVLEHRWFTIKNDGTVPESEGSLIPASGTDLDQGDMLYVSKQLLLFYGPDGAERGVLDTSQLLPEGVDYFGCIDLVVDGNDRLWLLSDQGLILSCGPDGGILTRSELKSTQYSPGFYLSRSGDVSLMLAQTSGTGLDELYAALGRMPEGCAVFPAASGWTSFYAASELCSLSLDGFVDWENGECSFDSEEFAALLDFASLFPASIDYADMHLSESESLRSGAALLCPLYITGFSQYANYASWFGEAGMTAIGYPELPGSGAVFAPDYIGLAISAGCEDIGAAWGFVRQLLDEDYQLGGSNGAGSFPTNRAAFDSRLESALEGSGSAGDRPAFTEEHAGALLALIEDTRLARNWLDDGLRAIIDEELSAFFAGARDAQAAAGLIQDRASTWIKEQL